MWCESRVKTQIKTRNKDMIDQTNPAGRLYKILSQIKSISDNTRSLDAWAQVIGCEHNDMEVTLAVVETYELAQEVQSLIMMHESINEDLYLKSFNQLNKVFFPLNLSLSIQGVKVFLSEEVLTRLQFCAEALSHTYAEQEISSGVLGKLKQMVENLAENINQAVMPEQIKLELLKETDKAKRAIDFYPILGAKGLKEASHSLLGTVITTNEKLNRIEDKQLLARIGQLIKQMDDISSRALRTKPIGEKISAFLPQFP